MADTGVMAMLGRAMEAITNFGKKRGMDDLVTPVVVPAANGQVVAAVSSEVAKKTNVDQYVSKWKYLLEQREHGIRRTMGDTNYLGKKGRIKELTDRISKLDGIADRELGNELSAQLAQLKVEFAREHAAAAEMFARTEAGRDLSAKIADARQAMHRVHGALFPAKPERDLTPITLESSPAYKLDTTIKDATVTHYAGNGTVPKEIVDTRTWAGEFEGELKERAALAAADADIIESHSGMLINGFENVAEREAFEALEEEVWKKKNGFDISHTGKAVTPLREAVDKQRALDTLNSADPLGVEGMLSTPVAGAARIAEGPLDLKPWYEQEGGREVAQQMTNVVSQINTDTTAVHVSGSAIEPSPLIEAARQRRTFAADKRKLQDTMQRTAVEDTQLAMEAETAKNLVTPGHELAIRGQENHNQGMVLSEKAKRGDGKGRREKAASFVGAFGKNYKEFIENQNVVLQSGITVAEIGAGALLIKSGVKKFRNPLGNDVPMTEQGADGRKKPSAAAKVWGTVQMLLGAGAMILGGWTAMISFGSKGGSAHRA